MIEDIKKRIADIELSIAQSVANHNGLLSRLDEAKIMLEMASKVAHAVAPGSAVDTALTTADQLVDNLSH